MFDPEPASSAAIVINGNNTTVRGIAFNGMNKTCITGIFILNGSSLTFTELEFTGFKVCAWWMHQGYNVELTKSKFLGNNSMGNTVQAYGAIMFHRTDNFKIDGCEIRERGTHSYGIKMASKDQCDMWSCVGEWSTNFNNNNIEISNCIIDVDESGTWQNGLAPAIAIEFNSDIECLNTNIHNNWINNHISLVTWEKNRASYRVHHNVADFRWKDDGSAGVRYAYFVEANDSYFEIDHNIVLSRYYPVAQWGTNHINKDMLMHHNIFYAPQGGSGWPPFFHWNADYNGFKFYNNTIIDTKNISEIFDLEAGGLCYSNSEIKNNVIMSTSNRGNILGNSCEWNGTVSNNLFYNISAAGSNYITSNPLLVNSGDMTLSESFGLQSNIPAINSGVAITGITTDAVGLPDMGAVEYGQTPWLAGPITTNIPVTGVTISPTTASVLKGVATQLTATIAPANATNIAVSWISSNTAIATVSTTGLVTAVAAGTATITVTTQDGNKTAICDVTVTSPVSCSGTGSILLERYDGITGEAVSNLTLAAKYPNSPDFTSNPTSFESVTDFSDNYGLRLRGLICPPAKGLYTFWIAGDDNVELWLSTNNVATNKVKIAYHNSWTSLREWNKISTQKSAAITLQAGTNYYIEALMKEGAGGDNLAVGWAKPGQATTAPSEVIPGSSLIPISLNMNELVIQAEAYNTMSGILNKGTVIGNFDNGDWLQYNNVNLGTNGYNNTFTANVACDAANAGHTFQIRLDSTTGTIIGTITVPNTGGWTTFQTVSTTLTGGTGIQNIFVVGVSNTNGIADIDWYKFSSLKSAKLNAVAIGAKETNDKFIVYPNPSTGTFQVEVNDFYEGLVRVFDLSGKLLIQQKLSNKKQEIKIENFKGLAVIQLISNKQNITQKILIK